MKFWLSLMLLAVGPALAQSQPPAACFASCGATSGAVAGNPAHIQACLIRCRAAAEFNAGSRRGPQATGRGVPVAQPATLAGRWGAIYAAPPPSVAVGSSHGGADRTMVHVRAENECRARGQTGCRLLTEFSAGCGAAAQATRTVGLVQTTDISTSRVSFIAAGTGASRADAERSAISVCSSREPTASCRIVASACVAG
jgi:hypothetical protein